MANQIRYQVGFDVNAQNLNQLKSSLQDLQKLKVSDVMKINSADIQTAKGYIKEIGDQARKVQQALDKAFNAKLGTVNLETFKAELKDLPIQQVYQTFTKAGAAGEAAFRGLTTQLLTTNMQLKESHALLDKMATTLANTIKWNAASSVVNGFSRSVEQAWGYVKALDTSLNDIRIVTGKSSDEMAKFAVQANNAAKELGKTTTDYTNAALIYAQQGLSDEQIQARAAITLKAANVTGQSTDDVSEQLTAVWNGYKVTADEAQLYVDRLAAVAATTASDLQELSTGMSKVASAAAAMGVGQDQLAAQLSTIISVTRQAPESVGTALRTVYARISDIKAGIDEDGVTLGNYSGKMAELGFNVLDMNGNLRDMGEVMEEIGNKWSSLTREQQVSLAQTMAGQRQYSNLIALFDNFEKYNEALATAQGAAGTLQEQQDTYMESTAAHLQVLKASMEDIYDSLADTDSINSIIDALSQLATFGANFVDSIGGGIGVLRDLGAVAMMVFSKQIANSLVTTINNFERMKQQANAVKNAIEMAEQINQSGAGNDYTKFLVGQQSNLLNLADRLSPTQFNEIQNQLQQLSDNANKLEIVKEKNDLLKLSFESLGKDINVVTAEYGGLDAALQSADGVEKIKNALNNLKEKFDPVINKQNELRDAFNKLNSDMNNSQNFSQNFENAKKAAQDLIDTLKIATISKGGETLFNSLPEEARKSVELASKELKNLNISGNIKEDVANVTEIFTNLSGVINGEINKIKEAIKNADEGELEKLQQRLKELEAIQDTLENGFKIKTDKLGLTKSIQDTTALIGGFATLGASIQQVQNLGSIWSDDDLTTSQKMLQTVTNLGTALPMMVTGFQQAQTALSALFGLSMGWAGLIIAGIGALTWAVTAYISTQEQARKQAIQTNKARIEQANKIQQQIQAQRGLNSSLEQLQKKYEQHEITRKQLKSQIEDLIAQYGLQGQAADRLRQNYDNLKEAILAQKQAAAEQGKTSAKEQMDEARSLITNTAMGQGSFNKNGTYTMSVFGGLGFDEPEAVRAMLDNLSSAKAIITDTQNGFSQLTISMGDSTQEIVAFYNELDATIKQMESSADPTTLRELNQSEFFSGAKQWVENMKPAIQAYKSALDDYKTYATQLKTLQLPEIKNQTIDSVYDYIEARQKLKESLKKQFGNKYNSLQLDKMVDAQFARNHKDLYLQFDESRKKVEEWKKQLGEIPQELKSTFDQALSELDDEHLSALFKYIDLDPSLINNWDELLKRIQQIAEMDLSNLSAVDINKDNFQDYQRQAAQNYNKYQGIQNTVRSGGTISSEDFDSLIPSLQKYFKITADATYKMQGDAEEFYNKINSLKLNDFAEGILAIEDRFKRISQLQNSNVDYTNADYDKLTQSSLIHQDQQSFSDLASGKRIETNIDWSLAKEQAQYLKDVIGDTDPILKGMVDEYYKLADGEKLTAEQAQKLRDLVDETGDYTGDLSEKIAENSTMYQQLAHQLHDAMFPTDSDIDQGELGQLTKVISELDDKSDELSDDLKNNSRDAEDVAESILRFDDAIQDVVDHYDDWMSALSNGSMQQQNQAMQQMRDAYADLLDMDASALPESFLKSTENLELMKQAIDGDVEAYNQLLENAGQEILKEVGIDTDRFFTDRDTIQNAAADLANTPFDDIQIGASLNDAGFLQACTNMVNAAGMTAQQATDYLASMGVDAQVIQTDTEAEEVQQQTGFQGVDASSSVPYDLVYQQDLGSPVQHETGQIIVPGVRYEPIPNDVTNKKQNKAFSLRVTSAKKSSGGGFKFNQAKNGGGSAGQNRRNKGGKGGGGGGGGSKPDTSKKERKKPLKRTADPYHNVNRDLKEIDRSLQNLTKDQDKLFGKQYIDNLNKQNATLQKSIAKLKEKQKIQKQDLKNQRQTLKNLGVTFDKYNNIANYQQILTGKQSELNGLIAQRNELVQKYNKSTDKAYKEGLSAAIKEYDDKIKQGEDALKQLQSAIKQYEDTQNEYGETNDALDEALQKQIENNIKKFRYAVELRLDMGEAARDWNDFVRNVLQPTDILKDSEFDELFGDVKQDFNDLRSYFGDGDLGGSIGSIEKLTNQLKADFAEINEINETGWSDIYGKDKAQAMEHLVQDWEELMNQMGEVEQLVKNIDKAYLDTIDDIADQFDKQIEGYDFVNGLIQHNIDLLQILYGDENYAAMDKYYNKMLDNQNKQIDSLRKQADFWKQQRDAAIAAGQTNAAEKFEENYKRAIQNINSAIQDGANLLKEKYTNTINLIFDELNNKLTNGKGLSYLGQEWEYMQDAADEYLDTVNSAYELQSLENKFQKAINNTEGLKNQKALKKLMDEQLENLKTREKLTQYDVDRAEKLLQVQQARIALEQAQSSKTSLRLKRDAQGNYSYQYVADEQGIQDAQQGYLNAQNELYNFDNDKYKQNLDDMYNAYQEFQEKIAQIRNNDNLDAIQKMQQEALAHEAYQDKITGLLDQNLNIRNNLMDSAIQSYALLYNTNVDNYRKMSDDQRDILMNELVPEWDSGIQIMMNKIVEEGGFIPSTQDAFEKLHQATRDYEEELEQMAEIAGISLNQVAEGTDELTDEFSDLVEQNDQLIDRMITELNAITELKTAADALKNQYENVTDAAKDMVSQIQQVIQNEREQAASYAETGRAYQQMTDTIYQAAANLQARLAALSTAYQSSGDNGSSGQGSNGSGSGNQNSSSTQKKSNNNNNNNNNNFDYYKFKDRQVYQRMATGGYTGDWATDEGRVAMLDKKELVLNQDDTKNFLSGISILRQIAGNFKGGLQAKMSNIKSGFNMFNNQSDTIEQNVKIEASFPNVNSKQQIEDAFNNLVNLAAQRAMRR